MSRERWGTFSVIDHKDAAALVPEVLLYDRLVLPVPTDDEERRRWDSRGWAPDILDRRLDELGDLAIKANWGFEDRRQAIAGWEQRLKSVRFDAEQVVSEIKEKAPYQMTRMVLADTKPLVLPPGVTSVVSVAAFQSEQEFSTCYRLQSPAADRSTLGYLLGQRLAVPDDKDPERALRRAITLAREDAGFRENRRKLYEWQEGVIREEIKPRDALREMDQMILAYNRAVEKAVHKVSYRFAFTVAGIALAVASAGLGIPLVLASAGALLTLVQFATLDWRPVVEAGESAPAAMFHDIKKIRLWQ